MKNKKILITGGLGFIGSHFVELINNYFDNSTIHVVDIYDYCTSLKTDALIRELNLNSNNDIFIFKMDINDFVLSEHYDYIVNFAAQSHVDRSIEDGNPFLNSNVNGTFNLLNQMDKYDRFIQIGTDEVYGSLSFNDKPSIETDMLKPSSVYSSTKASADLIAMSFFHTYNKSVIVTRCTNNFGTRQYTEKLIPTIIDKILKNENIPIYGDGQNVRQWIHVKEHCEMIYNLMLHGNSGNTYNICSNSSLNGNSYNNTFIAGLILEILEKDKNLITYVDDRKGHDLRYALNSDKTKRLFECKNIKIKKYDFFKDLTETVDWYVNNQKWWTIV